MPWSGLGVFLLLRWSSITLVSHVYHMRITCISYSLHTQGSCLHLVYTLDSRAANSFCSFFPQRFYTLWPKEYPMSNIWLGYYMCHRFQGLVGLSAGIIFYNGFTQRILHDEYHMDIAWVSHGYHIPCINKWNAFIWCMLWIPGLVGLLALIMMITTS